MDTASRGIRPEHEKAKGLIKCHLSAMQHRRIHCCIFSALQFTTAHKAGICREARRTTLPVATRERAERLSTEAHKGRAPHCRAGSSADCDVAGKKSTGVYEPVGDESIQSVCLSQQHYCVPCLAW
jgi:hypothetical protein